MTEEELLRLYFVEDRKPYAFNMMVRTYSERLYWQIRRIVNNHEDADDVLQNTFIKVWKGLPKFRKDAKLYSWMYRIATNEALNHLKSNKAKFTEDANLFLEHLKEDPYFDGDEAYQKLLWAIAQLPDKQKLVFNLKYFEDQSYAEILELLGGSEGSLKASYHHAVKKIKEMLELN